MKSSGKVNRKREELPENKPNRRAKYDIQLDRHEAKYIIPRSMVPDIVRFIEPFCEPDPNGQGDPPEYVITTLQLDTPDYALHRAKPDEALNRFKLRIRTYGEPGTAPVFLEVKKKFRNIIVKSRSMLSPEEYCRDIIFHPPKDLEFRSRKEREGFLEFVRLRREINAEPKVYIRYTRQSYFGKYDQYARVTFDRKLLYQPTNEWESFGRGRRWIPMDTELAQRKLVDFSGVVLELKTLSNAPMWMVDLVRYFRLERTGNCKYSTAVWQEALFRGEPMLPQMYTDDLSY